MTKASNDHRDARCPAMPANLSRCILVLLLTTGCALAQNATEKPESPVIRSACEVDYPPFCIVDKNGQAQGFSVELMRAAVAKMGREVTFRTGPWTEVRGWLQRGDIDALPLVGRTPEREDIFDFTVPYLAMHGAIVVREDATDIRDLDDLRDRRVAVMKADNAEEFLRREDRGMDILTTPTFSDALRALAEAECDAVVMQRLVALRLLAKPGLEGLRIVDKPIMEFQQDFCFAVREGDRDALALLNEGLALVVADGTHRRLHAKWFAKMQLPSDRHIVIGGDHNYPPFEFLDQDGRPAGFSVELTRAIARETGLDIEIRLQPWADVMHGLANGQVDALQGMFYSSERDRLFAFSSPYIINHCVAVTHRDGLPPPTSIETLSDLRIVVQEGDIMHEFARRHGLTEHVTTVDAQEDALKLLIAGRQDCALVARMTALYLIERHGWSQLRVGDQPFLSPEYCYAVPDGSQALLAQLSEGLKAIEQSGEYRRIYRKWLGVYTPAKVTTRDILKVLARVAGPLALVALVALVWSWSLRRQVAQRTEELRQSSEYQRAMIACSPVALYSIDKEGTVLTWNRSAERVFGWAASEIVGKPLPIVPDDKTGEFEALRNEALSGQGFVAKELVRLRKDGTRFHVSLSVAPIHDQQGHTIGILGAAEDISERIAAEEKLRASEERFRSLVEGAPEAIFIQTDWRFAYVNDAALRLFGADEPEQLLGQPVMERFHPSVRDEVRRRIHSLNVAREQVPVLQETYLRLDGTEVPTEVAATPTTFEGKDGALVFVRDITERRAYQARIEHLNLLLRAIRDVNQLIVRESDAQRLTDRACALLVEHRSYEAACILLTDSNGRITGHAQAGLDILFGSLAERNSPVDRLPPCCTVDDDAHRVSLVKRPAGLCQTCPFRADCPGDVVMCTPLERQTQTFGYLAVSSGRALAGDTEEQNLFREMADDVAYALDALATQNARLEAEKARETAQRQLLQAQKLESVGRLAGGVAHDFNNLITGIMNYVELCRDDIEPDHPIRPWLDEMTRDAERSANLTRQLLAFARKQTIAPKHLDINHALTDMLSMLDHLIGEDIELKWRPGEHIWPVNMDPGQLDQILVNLSVNARDAIGGTGQVAIETANVTIDDVYADNHVEAMAGDWVMLAVSDTGHGMEAETLSHVFEPFFTTKSGSGGTGLGLATVHGIAKQNGGFVNVYSEVDSGTTFKIYLPRARGEAETSEKPPTELAPPPGGAETIFLVEDEKSVRITTKTFLENVGYTVLTAETPDEALKRARHHPATVDLLVTDVVLPGMSGRELADRLAQIFPGIACLFISGYTANVIAHRGILDEDVEFLAKPFTRDDITRKVRDVLDSA